MVELFALSVMILISANFVSYAPTLTQSSRYFTPTVVLPGLKEKLCELLDPMYVLLDSEVEEFVFLLALKLLGVDWDEDRLEWMVPDSRSGGLEELYGTVLIAGAGLVKKVRISSSSVVLVIGKSAKRSSPHSCAWSA